MTCKTIYMIRGSKNESYPAFKSRIFEKTGQVVKLHNPSALWVTLTVERPPRRSVIPFRKNKIAAVSLRSGTCDLLHLLTEMPGFCGAYRVEEAIPVGYQKDWTDNTPTPGVNLLTLFHQRPGITRETFLDRWHNSHTPLSLKIHPLWNYNRNVVLEKLAPQSEPFDGIVEEQTRTREELLNPFKFFGPWYKIIPRMLSVYFDTKSFLDYKRIETYLAEETVVRSDE